MADAGFYGRLVDYHMHTPLCHHAEGAPAEYARRAAALGLKEIGFSEHCPLPDGYDRLRLREDQLGDYVRLVEEARRAAPGMVIRLGVEAEYVREDLPYVRRMVERHAWDYILGSVHYMGMWNFDAPEAEREWRECADLYEKWRQYFELWREAASSGLYDTMGHPDLVKKFGPIPREDCRPLFREALTAAAEGGVAVEINTAGLRKPVKEIYPSAAFLRIACEMGVPISFGSDAHAPDEVGSGFRQAVDLARACGYREYARFEKRRRTLWPLPA
ncbi:MAG: histidinol-phosphatase HisJ family protein [Verrucomicrobiae bacterium]|nr:histidinol-phosphatase HisJ family protein [Verrucomicrobiae bacterium]